MTRRDALYRQAQEAEDAGRVNEAAELYFEAGQEDSVALDDLAAHCAALGNASRSLETLVEWASNVHDIVAQVREVTP